jgi:hypothetical protein
VTGLPAYLSQPVLYDLAKLRRRVVRCQDRTAAAHLDCLVLAEAVDQLSQQRRNARRILCKRSQARVRGRAKGVSQHHLRSLLGQRAKRDPDGAVAFKQGE